MAKEFIAKLIQQDKIDLAFDEFEKLHLSKDHKKSLVILKNRFNSLEQMKIKGIISFEEYRIQKNRILDSLLTLLDNFSKTGKHKKGDLRVTILLLILSFVGILTTLLIFNKNTNTSNSLFEAYSVLTIPFENSSSLPIEDAVEKRLYQFSKENELNIICYNGSEFLKSFNGSYQSAKAIGEKAHSKLVLFGSSYQLENNSTFVNLRYQSILVDSFFSTIEKSHFDVKYIHEILEGKITGNIEEVIIKTSILIQLQRLLETPTQALEYLNSKIQEYENDAFLISLRANLYLISDRISSARSDYEYLIGIDPTNSIAVNNLGILYLDHFNKPQKAYKTFNLLSSKIPNIQVQLEKISKNYAKIAHHNPIIFTPKNQYFSLTTPIQLKANITEIRLYDSIYFVNNPIETKPNNFYHLPIEKSKRKDICMEIDISLNSNEKNPILINDISFHDLDSGLVIKGKENLTIHNSILSYFSIISNGNNNQNTIRVNYNPGSSKRFKLKLSHSNPNLHLKPSSQTSLNSIITDIHKKNESSTKVISLDSNQTNVTANDSIINTKSIEFNPLEVDVEPLEIVTEIMFSI